MSKKAYFCQRRNQWHVTECPNQPTDDQTVINTLSSKVAELTNTIQYLRGLIAQKNKVIDELSTNGRG